MASGPKIATTPLELLSGPAPEPPFLSKYWAPFACGVIGFSSVCLANYVTKRPVWSGLQKHVLLSAGLAGIGKVVDDYRNQYMADRDAVLRHYVELHPEDFPPFERKQYKDILESWIPIR
ncbi:unnamed protein product [Psylliodes chrysocephalus]|uniref:NADH dehydrogenase [ubiquinone] 1 subunit C2 n=1 Tax=Psylliodes chrysocephalus TaxID=3402493 RepID=A0A9P0GCW5_9CUCU|nr:unnamed protein product [Psylliodes chrysocephala]